MSGRKPTRPARVTAAQLREGWAGPAGCRIRLARLEEAEAAAALIRMADADGELPDEVLQLVQSGLNAALVLRGLDEGPQAIIEQVAVLASQGLLHEAIGGLASVLVAQDPGGQVVATSLTFPPGAIIARALQANLNKGKILLLALAILKIKGVAVAESARGAGLGQALLRRIVQIYDQVDYRLLYGQFSVGSGLETYYARQGFEVLGEQAGVPLGPVFDLPITVGAPPGERLFVRWNPSRRR
jgi:GNAT superfamily N-acetyltransferase